MSVLNFADNIVQLRHDKKITQGELADFIGVTKASVSKWETKQSMPDIVLLPQLAAFFDITVDELLGYEPVLSREQIQKVYYDLAGLFTKEPFEDVFHKSERLVKQYYSCYSFLLQICVLWLNHFNLADGEERQQEVLRKASDLCGHIVNDCRDIGLCNDAIQLKASVDLRRGKAEEVVETLEEIQNPYRLNNQSDGNLLWAYQMAGKVDKADRFAQISMYTHLLMLITDATHYLAIHGDDESRCEETIRRIDQVIDVYEIRGLHPNSVAVYEYQAACYYCAANKKESAVERLREYVNNIYIIIEEFDSLLHGDRYFDHLEEWFEGLYLGPKAPRDKKLVIESSYQTLCAPVFSILDDVEEFKQIKTQLRDRIAEMEENYESN